MGPRALLALASWASLASLAIACARPQSGDASNAHDERPAIAQTHQRKCASCHRLVEPGARTRLVIEQAAARHDKRVRLTPDEWRALVDYLAPPASSAAHVSVSESWQSPARPD
jgi:hypothetical protein